MKTISMELNEYAKELEDQFTAGYSLCLQHIKQVVDTGSIEVSPQSDDASKALWAALMNAFKKGG
jgi:hypothetical protein